MSGCCLTSDLQIVLLVVLIVQVVPCGDRLRLSRFVVETRLIVRTLGMIKGADEPADPRL